VGERERELTLGCWVGLRFGSSPVPVRDMKAVVDVEGIPEGDDYFCVFMDSYDGTVSGLVLSSGWLREEGMRRGGNTSSSSFRRTRPPSSIRFGSS